MLLLNNFFWNLYMNKVLLNQGSWSSWKSWRGWNNHWCHGCWSTWLWRREGEWPTQLWQGGSPDQGEIWNLIINKNIQQKIEHWSVNMLTNKKLLCCKIINICIKWVSVWLCNNCVRFFSPKSLNSAAQL